ncbi:hypothetical protein AOQ84DRAFT_416672, partial [Glonium stellatum]
SLYHGAEPCPLCSTPCEVRCSHSRCDKRCSEPCTPCAEERCASACVHGRCTMPCAASCDWVPCSLRCTKTLKCGHQCPSVCGEKCPDQRHCQTCADGDVKSMCVDYIEGILNTAAELDKDPCIFPQCGHTITLSNMDCHMKMSAHYFMTTAGMVLEIKKPSEPFSFAGKMVLPSCPQCRGSLRNISRYGRIVRRALLDESTKKFLLSLYFNRVCKEEVPFVRVRELVESTRRCHGIDERFFLDSKVSQTTFHIMANALLLQCDLAILSDFIAQVHKSPSRIKLENFLDLSINRQDCAVLVEDAKASNDLVREAEAHVFWARYCALERRTSRFDAAQAVIVMCIPGETLGDKVLNLKHTMAEIKVVESNLQDGAFFSFVTTEERRAVLAAMANEFSRTGIGITVLMNTCLLLANVDGRLRRRSI